MKKVSAVFAMVALMSGCTMPAVIYKPNAAMANPPRHQLRVAVTPFEELSPENTLTESTYYRAFLMPIAGYASGDAYLPPWYPTGPGKPLEIANVVGNSFLHPQMPSQVTRYEKSLSEDLQASGLFSSVEFKDWSEAASMHSNYDLIITGRYYYDRQHVTIVSVFFDAMLAMQPLLGLPMGSIQRDLAFEVQALDPENPAEPLWSEKFKVHDDASGVFGVYYGASDPRPTTPALWNKAFLQVRASLAKNFGAGGPLNNRLSSRVR